MYSNPSPEYEEIREHWRSSSHVNAFFVKIIANCWSRKGHTSWWITVLIVQNSIVELQKTCHCIKSKATFMPIFSYNLSASRGPLSDSQNPTFRYRVTPLLALQIENEVSIHTAGRVYSDRRYMHTANKHIGYDSKLGQHSAALTRCPSGSVVSVPAIVAGDPGFEYHSCHFFCSF